MFKIYKEELEIDGKKLVLETGDIVKIKSNTASSIDTIISVMEQT